MTKKHGGADSVNYGLGILIVLLVALCYVCFMNKKSYACGYTNRKRSYNRSGLNMGGSYGYRHGCGNMPAEMPNSKTSMRHLYDEQAHKYGTLERSSNIDDLQVLMHMEKRTDGGCTKGPRSKTESHVLMSPSGHERETVYA